MKAWTFQDTRQKKTHGAKAPWSVGWFDPEGRRRSKHIGLKSSAEKYRQRVEGEIAAGVYETKSRKSWTDFRSEFDAKIAAGMEPSTRYATLAAIKIFERIAKPMRVSALNGSTILDGMIAANVNGGLIFHSLWNGLKTK